MATSVVWRSFVSVGVIGLGRVGGAVIEMLSASGIEVVSWDIRSDEPYPYEQFAVCEYAVICVGTPEGPDGGADIAAVEAALKELPAGRVLLKSTVPPGTTARLISEFGKQICYSPEYVGESRYYNPYFPDSMREVPFVILGGEPELRRWFVDQLMPILGPTKRYFQCATIEAEVIKYAENAFFATKITFVNEFRSIAEAVGADWHTVREGWLLDPRIEPMHTAAFATERGFGGKCLPKDLEAIIVAAHSAGYEAGLLREVSASNRRFRAPAR